MTNSKHIIAVVGPTAVGKTARAIEIAQKFQTEIVSADSRQVYQEMNIGVARPSLEELSAVPHHFIASHSIHQPLTAGQFEREAFETLSNLFQVHDTVVVVGGSGLYIKALVEGLDNLPKDEQVRTALMEEGESLGWDQLSKKLEELDPEYARTADLKNPRRLVRALEVMAITGKKFSELRLKAAL
ncbi:MAG: tRNA ((37)-N6)-dimethylallyltransferase MiaA, partial [Bacteroidota bacterium]